MAHEELRAAAIALVDKLLCDWSICPVCDADLGETVAHEPGCELEALASLVRAEATS